MNGAHGQLALWIFRTVLGVHPRRRFAPSKWKQGRTSASNPCGNSGSSAESVCGIGGHLRCPVRVPLLFSAGLMGRKPVATGLGSRGFRGRIVRTNRSRPKSEGPVQIGVGGSRPEVELVPLRAALEAWIGVSRKMNGEDAALPASSSRGSDTVRALGRPTKPSPRTR
jgi:hypothetical protein